MTTRTRWIAIGALAVIGIVGASAAAASGGGDGDTPLTGSDLDRASKAALAHTGGGTVIESEVGDGGAAYGIEIRLPDGRVVELSLNASFEVIGQEFDDDGTETDPNGASDD